MTKFRPPRNETSCISFERYCNFLVILQYLSQKSKILAEKWDTICQKSWHYVDDLIRTRETSTNWNPTLPVKCSICAKCFC